MERKGVRVPGEVSWTWGVFLQAMVVIRFIILASIYELRFCETSYGFRPGRGAHDALRKCREYLNAGKFWMVDMDLEKFFDTVSQSKHMEILSSDIKDGTIHNRMGKLLQAGRHEKAADEHG